MAYADWVEQAQQEQLDWLHEIHEQEKAQTQLLRNIARHTALIYGCTVVFVVLVALWLAARLFDVVFG